MVLLKLYLFILNINSSPFSAMLVLIKGIGHRLTSPVAVAVADCACPLSTVYFWMS
jgi:hypothetical protein